jgi:hypothetical protein
LGFCDCFDGNNFKTLEKTICTNGTALKHEQLVMFKRSSKKSSRRIQETGPVLEAKSETLLDFLLKIKKGSKKIRTILDSESINQSDPVDLRIVNSFATITNTTVPDVTVLKKALGLWNKFYFTNDFREFLFKQRNNTLGLRARVAHFDKNADESCTFCRLLYPAVRTREDFLHLFRN